MTRSMRRRWRELVGGAEKRRTPQGTYGNGPFNSPEDFTAYDRCLTLGVVGSMMPKISDPTTYTRPFTTSSGPER